MSFQREDISDLNYDELCELAEEMHKARKNGEVHSSERTAFDEYCAEITARLAQLAPPPPPKEEEPKRGDYWPKLVGVRRAKKELALKQLKIEQAHRRKEIEDQKQRAIEQAEKQEADDLHQLDIDVMRVEAEHDARIIEAQQKMLEE